MSSGKCDHNALVHDARRWAIRCELCGKEWDSKKVRKALLSLEADKRQIDEVQRALKWIQRDVSYIKRQLERK
jgi:hypothetical protein